MSSAQEIINGYLNQIIDEIHPLFTAISDEVMVENNKDYGVFQREFAHTMGKKFLMKWSVYYGTPETVKTVFHPAVELA